jgi:hypothetical protein
MNCLDKRLFLEFCQCLTIDRDALSTHTEKVRASVPNYKEQPNPSTQRTTKQIGETASYFRSAPPLLEI